MNWKTIITIFVFGIITFYLGWFIRDKRNLLTEISVKKTTIENLQKSDSTKFKALKDQLDSLTIESNSYDKTRDFKTEINGEFILKGAKFAGFNFINSKIVSWTNEMDIAHPDTLKIQWLNNSTFFTQDLKKHNESCPPRVWIYQIISFDGKQLILKKINTSWIIDFPDSKLEFYKVKTSKN